MRGFPGSLWRQAPRDEVMEDCVGVRLRREYDIAG